VIRGSEESNRWIESDADRFFAARQRENRADRYYIDSKHTGGQVGARRPTGV